MAISARNLKSEASHGALKRITSKRNEAKTFAANGAAATLTLEPGTPVAFNTSSDLWVPWLHSGSTGVNVIKGIVWPNKVVLNASGGGETIGSVMLEGEAHFEDLDLTAVASTLANLKTSLQQGGDSENLRREGIYIKELDKVQ